MSYVLDDLLSKKFTPFEWHTPLTQDRLEMTEKIQQEERYFSELLTGEEFCLLQKLLEMQTVSVYEERNQVATRFFAMGMLLMLDVTDQAKKFSE